jgi:Putative auto-transporter adhesin, head GIN domain
MMRNALLALPLFVLAACSAGQSASRSAGPAGARSFSVGNFDAVSLDGSDDVRVVRGAATSVVASGAPDVLDKLDIRVEGSTLKVSRKRQGWGMHWARDGGAKIVVTVPTLNGATVAGSGNMTVDRADGQAFDASVAGSGSLQLASLTLRRAKLSVAGSGELIAVGSTDVGDLSLSGSGDLNAAQLASRRSDISVTGSGNARAAASESAAISLAGSGDATVTGTTKCTVSKVGSGEAHCGS